MSLKRRPPKPAPVEPPVVSSDRYVLPMPVALINDAGERWEGWAKAGINTFTAEFTNSPWNADLTRVILEMRFGGSLLHVPTTVTMNHLNMGDTLTIPYVSFGMDAMTPQPSPTAKFTCMWCAAGPFPNETLLEEHEECCNA